MSGPLGLALPGGPSIHQHQVSTITVVEWDERPYPPGHEGYDHDAFRRRAVRLALGCPCGWMNLVDIKHAEGGG